MWAQGGVRMCARSDHGHNAGGAHQARRGQHATCAAQAAAGRARGAQVAAGLTVQVEVVRVTAAHLARCASSAEPQPFAAHCMTTLHLPVAPAFDPSLLGKGQMLQPCPGQLHAHSK